MSAQMWEFVKNHPLAVMCGLCLSVYPYNHLLSLPNVFAPQPRSPHLCNTTRSTLPSAQVIYIGLRWCLNSNCLGIPHMSSLCSLKYGMTELLSGQSHAWSVTKWQQSRKFSDLNGTGIKKCELHSTVHKHCPLRKIYRNPLYLFSLWAAASFQNWSGFNLWNQQHIKAVTSNYLPALKKSLSWGVQICIDGCQFC